LTLLWVISWHYDKFKLEMTAIRKKTLLIVGPQPPPVGGGTVNVEILLQELKKYPDILVTSINTSPKDCHRQTNIFDLEEIRRAGRIIWKYLVNIKKSDSVLIIATTTSIFTLGSILLFLARTNHVSCYIKPLGADLHFWLNGQKKMIQKYLVKVLSAASRVFVQTRELQTELCALGCNNVTHVPGYRLAPSNRVSEERQTGRPLQLVFLSQIYREKGALLLLEALRMLTSSEKTDVVCDFYGPILKEDRLEFLRQLQATPSAQYIGIAEIGTASQLMAKYDVLVFPTFCTTEGYPGVIIEAMQAGIPIISTRLPSISELITDHENGLLFPMGDSRALVYAIRHLASDHTLREKMGRNNYIKGQQFNADHVIYRMLQLMFPELNPANAD